MGELSIGDLVHQFVVKSGKEALFYEKKVEDMWPQVMGTFIANNTIRVKMKQGVLSVQLSNASLRFELTNSRTLVMQKINEAVGVEVVKSIVFI